MLSTMIGSDEVDIKHWCGDACMHSIRQLISECNRAAASIILSAVHAGAEDDHCRDTTKECHPSGVQIPRNKAK